jgi:hypothetical protein
MRCSSTCTFAFILGISARSAGACDNEDDVRVEERMCERFDECNDLAPSVGTHQLVSSHCHDWR